MFLMTDRHIMSKKTAFISVNFGGKIGLAPDFPER
jgi:hypothetical protein